MMMMPSAIQLLGMTNTVIQQGASKRFLRYMRAIYQSLPSSFCGGVPRKTTVMQHILRTNLAPRIQATGTWSSTGKKFQPGYRSLSVFGKGPAVAQYFYMRAGRSFAPAAIRALYAETGTQATCTFFLVFASYIP